MGCASSKLDDLPVVAFCRERCTFLDEAIHKRYALAEAHAAYLHSLKAVGVSLDRFFNHNIDASIPGPSSPVLNLPAQRKGEPSEPSGSPPEKIHHLRSHSDSGSHLHFHSDSEDEEDSGTESLHHYDAPTPVPPYGGPIGYMPDYETLPPGGRFTNINYMKKQTTPSVVYEQRPMIPETIHIGESSTSSSYPHPYANNIQNPPSYPYYNNNNNNNNNIDNYGNYPKMDAGGGIFGSSLPPAHYSGFSSSSDGTVAASSSKAPPPPPSPPKSSSWDFFNPFESFEMHNRPYTPSWDSREVREEEEIPDLEDEDDEDVKEVHGNQMFADSGSSYSKAGTAGAANEVEDERVQYDDKSRYRAKESVGTDSDPVEHEVHMVDKKVVEDEDRLNNRGNVAGLKARGGFKVDSEVVKEIQVQFERASESGIELSKLLEVGKLPYKHKHDGRHGTFGAVSSKILQLPGVASQTINSRSSQDENADPNLDVDQIVGLGSRNISSTLHKLYLWEKKLYEEVKVEEKMRVLHNTKSHKLKRLDERGAEAQKIEATRALVRSLSSKIRIAIQVVDKFSVKINSLRDDELWPQLNELIQGLTKMWKSMLVCHHNQCRAIGEAKRLDAIALRKHFSDAHLEATRLLEHDLINWTLRFSYWIGTQKSYIRALNSWLTKCIHNVPEETPDGIVPFSPGRIGAPPVFVICYQWSQSLEGISEKEVVDSMRDFATNVLQLWDRDKLEMRQRMLVNKDERKVKGLEREDQKIQKEIQALDKRTVLISGDDSGKPLTGRVVYQSETSKSVSLQASLQHVFRAMEKYAADSLKVYEELLQRTEEDRLAREHEQVS
ncbi:nitrate regulatory gene2 protein-like [Olea europaea var. sylvestris]|uniref:nitrate regulatory gene2 protein-like n=1 Tax=Olea europaea var. sylvestris TaxID=158386 RepID=UPI000C1CCC9D|nr:nitrate regulatory gene2 protein-like [Olea europaea var. sylvestris]